MRPGRTRRPALAALALTLAVAVSTSVSAAVPDRFATPLGSASERWRAEIGGDAGNGLLTNSRTLDDARGLAILPDGSVVVAGVLRNQTDEGGGSWVSHDEFAVLKRDGATGADLGSFVVDGGILAHREAAEDVAGDSQGNTIAAGRLRRDQNGSFNFDMAVVKLDANMLPVWTGDFYFKDGSESDTGAALRDNANAVAVDGNDDIFAAGILIQATTGRDLGLCKIKGSDGSELWCTTVDGTESSESPPPDMSDTISDDGDQAFDLAVDSNDDVIVIGSLEQTNESFDIYVAKFAGAGDGMGGPSMLWERTISGSANSFDVGFSVVTGPATGGPDAVYITGFQNNTTTDFDIFVARLDGMDGSTDWSRTFDDPTTTDPGENELGAQIILEPISGDVIVTGSIQAAPDTAMNSNRNMFLARLDEATGAPIWQGSVGGNVSDGFDDASGVAVLTNGDIAMVGSFQNDFDMMSGPDNNPNGDPDPSNLDYSIAVFDGAGDGQGGLLEKWRIDLLGWDNRFPQTLPPFHSLDFAGYVAAAPDGDLFVAGAITRRDKTLVVGGDRSNDNTNILIARVPEPASTVVAIGALGTLAALRRRRSRASSFGPGSSPRARS